MHQNKAVELTKSVGYLIYYKFCCQPNVLGSDKLSFEISRCAHKLTQTLTKIKTFVGLYIGWNLETREICILCSVKLLFYVSNAMGFRMSHATRGCSFCSQVVAFLLFKMSSIHGMIDSFWIHYFRKKPCEKMYIWCQLEHSSIS